MVGRLISIFQILGLGGPRIEEGGQPFAFLTQFFIDVQIGLNRWDFRTFVQIDARAIQIDM